MSEAASSGPAREQPVEPPPGWPCEWWAIYGRLHDLWDAGQLAEGRRTLESALPAYGNLATAKLALAYQLLLESTGGLEERKRIRDLVLNAVSPEERDPHVLVSAAALLFDVGALHHAAVYLSAVAPMARQLHPKDAAATLYMAACIQVHVGERQEAEAQLRAAVDASPDDPLYASALEEVRRGVVPAPGADPQWRVGPAGIQRTQWRHSASTTTSTSSLPLRLTDI